MVGLDDPELLDECDYLCGTDDYHHKDCPLAKLLRGTWCTPKWLADLLDYFDVDPCSNERSHIRAQLRVRLDDDGEGIHDESVPGSFLYKGKLVRAEAFNRVFINPPYGPGEVERWVRHYRHTKFAFLLRWDPSTAWASELIPHCTHVWFPDKRLNFDPPPRIRASINPFPHALYLRQPSVKTLENLSREGYVFAVDSALIRLQSAEHGQHQRGDRAGGTSASGGGAAAPLGPGGGWKPDLRVTPGPPGKGCIDRTLHGLQCCEACA